MRLHNSLHSDRLANGPTLDNPIISSTNRPTLSNPLIATTLAPTLGLISGLLAGGIEATLTYPLDFAKTQAQLRFNRRWRHIDTPTFIRRTIAAEGISALYTGLGTAVYGSALKAGLRYLVFDSTIHALKQAREDGKSGNFDYAAAGITAGIVESVVIATPSERIKTALIDDSNNGAKAKRFKSSQDAVSQIFRAEGISGLYRGLVSTTCKYAGTGAVKMGSYYFFAQQHANFVGHSSKSVQDTFALGAAAGVVTVCVTQPLDVVKTRRQSTQGETLVVAARNVLHGQGVAGFWSGSLFRLGRMSVSSGIVMSVHEKVVELLRVEV